jgi:hypothetical protein
MRAEPRALPRHGLVRGGVARKAVDRAAPPTVRWLFSVLACTSGHLARPRFRFSPVNAPLHFCNAFALAGGAVYHAYSAGERGVEFLMGYYPILDRARMVVMPRCGRGR